MTNFSIVRLMTKCAPRDSLAGQLLTIDPLPRQIDS